MIRCFPCKDLIDFSTDARPIAKDALAGVGETGLWACLERAAGTIVPRPSAEAVAHQEPVRSFEVTHQRFQAGDANT